MSNFKRDNKRRSKRLADYVYHKESIGLSLDPSQVEKLGRIMGMREYYDPITGEKHSQTCTCVFCIKAPLYGK
jgi:hypothetical protein